MSTSQLLSVIAEDGAVRGEAHGLSKDELLHLYRSMLLTRAFDDTCMKLQRSGRIGFSVPNKGVEASEHTEVVKVEPGDCEFDDP
mgnify:CR=1 FL=1